MKYNFQVVAYYIIWIYEIVLYILLYPQDRVIDVQMLRLKNSIWLLIKMRHNRYSATWLTV